MTEEQQKSANDLAQERTELAIERSVMAADRTLMAWIRTALSMIGFGFTIYKILAEFASDASARMDPQTPARIGFFLIGLGTLSIILGTMEYRHTMKHLDKLSKRTYKSWNFSTLAGYAVGLLGLFLIIGMIVNRSIF